MRELTGYEDKHGRPILEGEGVPVHVIPIRTPARRAKLWPASPPR